MGWGNIYKRRVKVFTVALIIYFDYKALQQREKWANKSKKASLWEKAHERNAKRVLNLIVELEGLWVKLGQYLSTRADVLPEAYTCLLKQLQDSLPPRSLKEVCRTIEKEFGKTMDDLFLDFDNVPLATASIAQVHHATLSDGQEVVVKVQHDGIKAVILEDLKNAKSIVDWVAWAEPQYNFHPMIDEWCKEAPKELDFNHEAENTRKVSRNLCCNKRCDDSKPTNHVDVLIPEVIQMKKFYQPRKSNRIVVAILQGHQIPLYGAIPLLSDAKDRIQAVSVPLNLTILMRSRANILGRLVNPKFYIHISCEVILRGKNLGKHTNLTSSGSCTYR